MDPDISPQEPEVNVDNINIESDDAVEEFSFETDTKEEEGEPSEEEIAVIERIRIIFFFFFFFTTSFFPFTSFTSLSLPPFAFPFRSFPLLPFAFLTRLPNSLGRLRTPCAFARSRPRENLPYVFWTGSFGLSQLALVTLLLLYERAQAMGLRRQRNSHRTRWWPTRRGRVPSPGTTSLGVPSRRGLGVSIGPADSTNTRRVQAGEWGGGENHVVLKSRSRSLRGLSRGWEESAAPSFALVISSR